MEIKLYSAILIGLILYFGFLMINYSKKVDAVIRQRNSVPVHNTARITTEQVDTGLLIQNANGTNQGSK